MLDGNIFINDDEYNNIRECIRQQLSNGTSDVAAIANFAIEQLSTNTRSKYQAKHSMLIKFMKHMIYKEKQYRENEEEYKGTGKLCTYCNMRHKYVCYTRLMIMLNNINKKLNKELWMNYNKTVEKLEHAVKIIENTKERRYYNTQIQHVNTIENKAKDKPVTRKRIIRSNKDTVLKTIEMPKARYEEKIKNKTLKKFLNKELEEITYKVRQEYIDSLPANLENKDKLNAKGFGYQCYETTTTAFGEQITRLDNTTTKGFFTNYINVNYKLKLMYSTTGDVITPIIIKDKGIMTMRNKIYEMDKQQHYDRTKKARILKLLDTQKIQMNIAKALGNLKEIKKTINNKKKILKDVIQKQIKTKMELKTCKIANKMKQKQAEYNKLCRKIQSLKLDKEAYRVQLRTTLKNEMAPEIKQEKQEIRDLKQKLTEQRKDLAQVRQKLGYKLQKKSE